MADGFRKWEAVNLGTKQLVRKNDRGHELKHVMCPFFND